MSNDLPEIMTIGEAAQYLRISSSSLYKLAQDGRVPCQKVGRHWRFHRETLLRWVAGQKDFIVPASAMETSSSSGLVKS